MLLISFNVFLLFFVSFVAILCFRTNFPFSFNKFPFFLLFFLCVRATFVFIYCCCCLSSLSSSEMLSYLFSISFFFLSFFRSLVLFALSFLSVEIRSLKANVCFFFSSAFAFVCLWVALFSRWYLVRSLLLVVTWLHHQHSTSVVYMVRISFFFLSFKITQMNEWANEMIDRALASLYLVLFCVCVCVCMWANEIERTLLLEFFERCPLCTDYRYYYFYLCVLFYLLLGTILRIILLLFSLLLLFDVCICVCVCALDTGSYLVGRSVHIICLLLPCGKVFGAASASSLQKPLTI